MANLADVLFIDRLMATLPANGMERLKSHFTMHPLDAETNLASIAPKIRGFATDGGVGLPRKMMDALPALEIISVNGVGTDQIDLTEARRRNIRVTTTLGILTDDVADMAIVLMLSILRNTVRNDVFVRREYWPGSVPPLARTVKGRRVGIVGFGHIGQAIAHRAAVFGVDLAYFNTRRKEESTIRFEPDLMALARWCDVLILAVSGNPRSAKIIDRNVLHALGPDGILINIARDSVVDEDALIEALQNNHIAGAGLDVFRDEPNINTAFLSLENVVLQPHHASATIETRTRMSNLMIDNMVAHFSGKPLLTPIL